MKVLDIHAVVARFLFAVQGPGHVGIGVDPDGPGTAEGDHGTVVLLALIIFINNRLKARKRAKARRKREERRKQNV